jgi:hypothetical protein
MKGCVNNIEQLTKEKWQLPQGALCGALQFRDIIPI